MPGREPNYRGPTIPPQPATTGGDPAVRAYEEARQRADITNNMPRMVEANPTPLDRHFHDFSNYARGHLLNKYQLGLMGDYVEEALRVLDMNAYRDKNTLNPKTYLGVPYRHNAFKQWSDIHYDRDKKVLYMFWDVQDVSIPAVSAKIESFNIDTVKSNLPYQMATGVNTPTDLTFTVVDDPSFMWYQFFNALFNVQFSPLALKPRSTWHKINIFVDVFQEATTGWNDRIGPNSFGFNLTGMAPAQMFEFNSCVLTAAPSMKASQADGNPYTFSVSFKYPNAFQGTCKEEFRYLKNNTFDVTDENPRSTKAAQNTKYGAFNETFYEESYEDLQKDVSNSTYEAFSKKTYNDNFTEKTLPNI